MIWSLIRCKETDIADDTYVVPTKSTIAVIKILGWGNRFEVKFPLQAS